MTTQVNIYEILKNCNVGTKLYLTGWGNVDDDGTNCKLTDFNIGNDDMWITELHGKAYARIDKHGYKYYTDRMGYLTPNTEWGIVLYPSKKHQTWEDVKSDCGNLVY